MMSEIQFLNVDLDIESRRSLATLVAALGDDVLVLHQWEANGLFSASLEAAECTGDAETTVNILCDMLEHLPTEVREAWRTCCTRVFNIGYASGQNSGAHTFQSPLHPQTVARLAMLGAGVTITIYPPADD